MTFMNYKFQKKKKRNNGYMVKLPNRKLEYGHLSPIFMGAKIFNHFLLEIRKQCFDKSLKSSLKSYLDFEFF